MDLPYSELFSMFALDEASGDLLSAPQAAGSPGRPGTFINNTWRLRWANAYWPATEVAWFLRYGRWPGLKVYSLDRNPYNMRAGNLVMGTLGPVNEVRRIAQTASAMHGPFDLTRAYDGVWFEPAPRDRATFDRHRAEWAAQQAHCAKLGCFCPAFIVWPSDPADWYADLDPLG